VPTINGYFAQDLRLDLKQTISPMDMHKKNADLFSLPLSAEKKSV